jgi:1,2-diacylglycerol 3-beta-galactosyltransferase
VTPKVKLVYIESGGGHRAAARALSQVLRERRPDWDVSLVCIQDVFNPIDFVLKYTGIPFQQVYNIMLRRGWTLGSAYIIPVVRALVRASHASQVRVLEAFWRAERPSLVVSLIPYFNRAMKEALDRVSPRVPYVTLLTDIADFPPHFWMENIDQWVICGSTRAVEQARETGLPEDRILRVSGMVLNPRFHEPAAVDRDAARARCGLKPGAPVGLVMFGGEGSPEMERIARALNHASSGVQLIFICGKNAAVAARLRAMEQRIPMFVEGFTLDVPLYLEMADFFIGKPGPGAISEALAKGLPVIVQRNAWTMAQEVYNTQWIEEMGTGIVVKDFAREIAAAVRTLLDPSNGAAYRDRASATRNLAVYEVADLLARILGEGEARSTAAR